MLQCVAVCCSVLLCIVAVVTKRIMLRWEFEKLSCKGSCYVGSENVRSCVAACCGALQCVAVCCSVLLCVAVCCSRCHDKDDVALIF